MQARIAPSLMLVYILVDALGQVSLSVARAAWARWFSPQRFQRRLVQFEAHGWVEGTVQPGNVDRILRITEHGRMAVLGGRDLESCWKRGWDGRWRLVMFDVPELNSAVRVRLWRKLRAMGLGYLQHSVWINPDPIDGLKDAVQGAPLDVGTLTLMEARPCGGETDQDIVLGAWDFTRINRGYSLYLEVLKSQPVRRSGTAWRNWFEVESKAWCKAVKADPLLPEVLLPGGYMGREAWQRRLENLGRTFRSG